MLRMGYFEGINLLVKEDEAMEGLFDVDIFMKFKQVKKGHSFFKRAIWV